MVELHPESRKLTTMALGIGRFHWTRLPMGSIIAQDVFQHKFDAIFLSVPGITGIADDMIIFRKTDQEHDGNLLTFWKCPGRTILLSTLRRCSSDSQKFPYLATPGVTKVFRKIQRKLKQKRMEISQDVETMRSFLGLINYLNHFSSRLAELSDPLREICRQKVEFQLTRACEIAFQFCREEISKNIMLPYYNPKSPTILQTDASKRGLGAVLLQNSTLVMFA